MINSYDFIYSWESRFHLITDGVTLDVFDVMVQVHDAAGCEAEAVGGFPGLDPRHRFPVQRSERVGSPGHRGAGRRSTVSGKRVQGEWGSM